MHWVAVFSGIVIQRFPMSLKLLAFFYPMLYLWLYNLLVLIFFLWLGALSWVHTAWFGLLGKKLENHKIFYDPMPKSVVWSPVFVSCKCRFWVFSVVQPEVNGNCYPTIWHVSQRRQLIRSIWWMVRDYYKSYSVHSALKAVLIATFAFSLTAGYQK